MNKVLIGIIVITILICFLNMEKFTCTVNGTSLEKDINNASNTGCARIDTSSRDYFIFKGKEVYCKNIVNGVKMGATPNGECPKNGNNYIVDGTPGACAANIPNKTGGVVICN
jgi:hypothetical protein